GDAGARALAQAEQRAARLRAALPPQVLPPPAAGSAVAEAQPATGAEAANAKSALAPNAAPPSFSAEPVDEEIRGIFIEEAREVLAALLALEPGDGARPPPALRELRRGFHTLKGSGRMVGADAIGALCWAVEAVLNRILEGDLAWSAAVAELVAEVLARLPALVDEFAVGGGSVLGPADAAAHARLLALAAPVSAAMVPAVPEALAATGSGATPQPVAVSTDGAAAVESELGAAELSNEALAQIEILERFRDGPPAGSGAHVEVLARAVHTLIGCCARSGDSGLARALRSFEELLTVHGERGLVPGAALWDVLARLAAAGRAAIGTSAPADLGDVPADLERIRSGLAGGRSRERLRALMAGGLGELLAAAEWLDHPGADGLPAARLAPVLAELEELTASAASAQLPELARLAGLLHAGGRQLLAGRCRPGAREIFRRGVAQLLLLLDAVAAALPPPEITAELMAQLGAMAEAGVEAAEGPAPATEVDAAADAEPGGELLAIFLEEAADLCEQLERAIAGRQIETLKRCLHTLKGSARMAGCTALGELCHEFETLVEGVDSATAPAPLFDTCLVWFDRIEREREHIARRGVAAALPTAEETIREPVPAAAVAPPEPPCAEPMVAAAVVAVPPAPSPAVWGALPAAGPSGPPPWRQHGPRSRGDGLRQAGDEPRELVKIAAPILANLANLADETSVSRSRIEQQLQQFHFQLEEMETTVQRFHDQVRQLGMETEAQILFRREQLTAEGLEDQFDPLEMDRYSTLQHLSRALEESASDLQDLKETLLAKVRETEALLIQQARVNRDLQENLSLTRMVPFSRVVPRLRRIVRQTSSELGKPVELMLSNIEGELDRTVLERVVPSLEHLIRNAIDHGIEAPQDRERAGKPATGQVTITFAREAGDVVIKVADDGRGLDLDAIRNKALALGLLGADAPGDDRALAQLIFHPGFSTAADLSRISGRGIGMDVVDSELRQLGGSVTPLSRRGQGVEFTLRVPFTISVNRALLMKAGRERYGTLVNSVAGVVRLDAGQLEQLSRRTDAGFEHGGKSYRVCRFDDLVGNPEPPLPAVLGRAALVLTKDAREPVAVLVDALESSQEVVVKALGPQFARVRGLSGATVLGDGQVVPILDLNALVDHAVPRAAGVAASAAAVPFDALEAAANILVVDDSVTMRKATARLLERQGYKVITARDGVEAMQFLQEVTPDLMLLDIEMPRMDGFEVVRQVRATARLAQLPIIMITSRSGDKHRGKAMALGADHYLGKPYQEDHLLAVVAASLPATGVPRHERGPGG
ncbi:MAG: Hpt domain-containing protein, partial [Pseudomonadales bacterium]|nr:Hpt domain-containing protein [Pseudomonadales bacterium]